MEVVGGVASIITLIEATGVLAEVSKNLVLRWRNAPHEIQALATRLSLLTAELQSIKNATSRSHHVLTDAIIRQSLNDLLTDVRKRLTKLETLHFRLEQHGPVRQRLQWTVKDAGSTEKMLLKTQEVEQRLTSLMTLISLRAQTPILDSLSRIEQLVSGLAIALPASVPVAPTISPDADTVTLSSTAPRTVPASKRTLVSSPWILGGRWESWGIRGALVTIQYGHHTDHSIDFSVSLPLARILGSYALTGCLSLRSTSLCRGSFTFRHPSYFAMARVVAGTHPFMVACAKGDTKTVRSMLRSGEGRPTDITANGQTPMLFALQREKTEVMSELLRCGVDVDAIIDLGDMRTALEYSSALKKLDNVRFLLQNGASADHTHKYGIGAGALCWAANRPEWTYLSRDIYNLISESTHVHERDRSVAVDLIAMSGCGSQIDLLVRCGYDIRQAQYGPTSPITLAAGNGNYSTYSALVSHFSEDAFGNRANNFLDVLRDTILGKAASFVKRPERAWGYNKILMDILQRCGDYRLWPLPPRFRSALSSDIESEGMTAGELAALLGLEIEAWYLSMIRDCGHPSAYEEMDINQRLCELSQAGYVTSGFEHEGEDDANEADGNVRNDIEEQNKDSDVEKENSNDNSGDEINDDSKGGTTSEAEDSDRFWDAPENFY